MNGKRVVNGLHASGVRNLVSGNAEISGSHVDDGVAGQPVLTPVCDVVLLSVNQFIILGTGCGVRGHVKGSLRIRYRCAACALNGVAVVVLGKASQSFCSGGIAISRIQRNLFPGLCTLGIVPVVVIACLI